jgi:hypothetical protein
MESDNFFDTVISCSSASNKNLRIYRRVDSETSSKGRLTVRAAAGPCTRFTSLSGSIFWRSLPEFGHGLREPRKNSRAVSKNRSRRGDGLRIAAYSSMACGD